jgi:predicted transcriptional regulator
MRPPTAIRSRQEIIRDILIALEKLNLPRTKVMYRASLSYTQLKYYEEYLQSNGLIVITEDELWMPTQKGKRYLDACMLADNILRMPSQYDQELVTPSAEPPRAF